MTNEDIRRWFLRGRTNPNCTHLVVLANKQRHVTGPTYVLKGEEAPEAGTIMGQDQVVHATLPMSGDIGAMLADLVAPSPIFA